MPRVCQKNAENVHRWIDEESGLGYDAEFGGLVVFDERPRVPDMEMIARLHAHAQRATYEARAGCSSDNGNVRHVVGPPCYSNSWIVNRATGLPSEDAGYRTQDIDPRLLRQHRQDGPQGLIDSETALRVWLHSHFVQQGQGYKADGWRKL
jgi:hypothetical protein